MDSKTGAIPQQPFEQPPPQYTAYPSGSGSTDAVVANTGLSQNLALAPPADAAEIHAKYDGVNGINVLKETDTIIVLDDSETMGLYGYWPLVEQLLCQVGPVVSTYDSNGISMYCLNTRGPSTVQKDTGVAGKGWNDITNGNAVREVFSAATPMGTTPIADKLYDILTPYLARLSSGGTTDRPRPLNILVLTDGVADDKEGVEELVGEVCEVLDGVNAPDNQIGIQFVQIADVEVAKKHINSTSKTPQEKQALIQRAINDEEESRAWLKDMDDHIQERVEEVTRDIIDTKSALELLAEGGYTPKNLIKVLVGAMSKRFDRMK